MVEPVSGVNKKIIVCEDEQALRNYLSLVLSRLGGSPLPVANLSSGITAVGAHQVAGAIVDVHLPDGIGVELVRRIRAVRPLASVVVITADRFLEDRLKAEVEELGAEVRFGPFSPVQVVEICRCALGHTVPGHPLA